MKHYTRFNPLHSLLLGSYKYTALTVVALILALVALPLTGWGQDLYTSYHATAGTGGTGNEGYAKLVDNNTSTKWCVTNFSSNSPAYVEFYSTDPIVPKSYQLTTANDNADYHYRNPSSWVIKAKRNQGDSWTNLVTVSDDETMGNVNFTSYNFSFDFTNNTVYQYFKFEVSEIQGGDNVLQISEFKFYATVAPADYCTPAPTSVDGSGITNVTFGSGSNVVNNSSSPTSSPYYGNYTNLVGDLYSDGTNNMSITYSTGYTYSFYVWVDWDNNKAFSQSEIVYSVIDGSSDQPTTLNFPITVPANTAAGNYRMRVGGADSGLDGTYSDDFPCYTGTWGVFHDYTVRVVNRHTLTFSASPAAGGSVSVSNGGTNVTSGSSVVDGTSLSITATPNSGYTFTGWTVSGTGASVANASNASTTLTMGTANTTLTANFEQEPDCDYYEDFSGTTASSGHANAGSLPSNWDYIYAGSEATRPHVCNASSYPGIVSSGNYLVFNAGTSSGYATDSYVVMPSAVIPTGQGASHISFKARFESDSNGTLTYGTISGTDASTYSLLGTVSRNNTDPVTVNVDLDPSESVDKRLAFHWYMGSSWYTCGIDDICVTTEAACTTITSFPWTETFESYSTGAFSQDCWVNEHISGSGSSVFTVYSSTVGGNSTHKLQLPDMSNPTYTKLRLPKLNLPSNDYYFFIDVYRSNNTYNSDNIYEGIHVYASSDGELSGATELAFIPRQYNTSSSSGTTSIGAVDEVGWYTYKLPIGRSGNCYIILKGESRYCTATYMDNFKIGKAYTVSYDANGGSGSMTDSDSPYMEGSTVTVKSNEFTRTGYYFTGWKTGASSGTSYAEGATFAISANTTLYAQWELAYTITVNTNTGTYGSVSGSGTYASGSTQTITATANANGYFYQWSDGNTNASRTITVTDDATYTAIFVPKNIGGTTDWNNFTSAVNGTGSYSGYAYNYSSKTVYLTDNVGTVTTMAGTSSNSFQGTFDGQCYTLNVNLSSSTEGFVAPFHYVNGATIQNLKVTGSCVSSASGNARRHNAGLVGSVVNVNPTSVTIENCLVSANVGSTSYRTDYCGGLIGHGHSGNITIIGSAYTGTLYVSGTYFVGGLIGWADTPSGVTITDCFFGGTYNNASSGNFHPVGVANSASSINSANISISNCYYSYTISNSGTVMADNHTKSIVYNATNKGKHAYSINAGTNVTVANAGTANDHTCNDSGITGYSGTSVGIKYNSTLYAGSGDNVKLTLSYAGGTLDGYTTVPSTSSNQISGGSNPYTLSMPAQNVTIEAITYYSVSITVYPYENNASATHDHPGIGTASVSPSSAIAGSTVTVTTSPNSGYKVLGIYTSHNDEVTTVAANSSYTFTMPSQAVTVYVVFAPDKTAITLNAGTPSWTDDFTGYTGGWNSHFYRPFTTANDMAWAAVVTKGSVGGSYGYAPRLWKDNSDNNSMTGARLSFKNNGSDYIIAALPEFNHDLNNLKVSYTFTPDGDAPNNTLELGYYNCVDGSFTVLNTHDNLSGSTYNITDFEVSEHTSIDLPGSQYRLAFRYSGSGTKSTNFYGITVSLSQCTITAASNNTSYGTVTGGGVYDAGATVTLEASPTANGYFYKWSDGETTTTHSAITASGDATYTAIFVPKNIASTTDWDNFADAVSGRESYVGNAYTYSGKTVYLTADVGTVNTMAGTGADGTKFEGAFDGQCHTLTINYTSSAARCAAFPVADNATFRNLKIDGTMSIGHFPAGALVGYVHYGCHFTNCISAVEITATVSSVGNNGLGGFLGEADRGSNPKIYFDGCAFTGAFVNTCNGWGGFVGRNRGYVSWSGSNSDIYFTDCVFAPTSIPSNTSGCATFARSDSYSSESNSHVHITNSYYSKTFEQTQGTQCYTITPGSNTTVALTGTTTDHNYAASCSGTGLVFYDNDDDNSTFDNGFSYNDGSATTLYAKNGGTSNLLLGYSVPANNTFFYYSASGGTLSGTATTGTDDAYTLTMPADNTTVTAHFVDMMAGVDPSCTDIGEESSTGSQQYGPFDAFDKYNYTQILYSGSTLPTTINSIAFRYRGTGAISNKNTVDIYLAETTATSMSAYLEESELTLVYTGAMNFTANEGWKEFAFNQNGGSFTHDPSKNIVVVINDRSNAYSGTSSSSWFYYVPVTDPTGNIVTSTVTSNAGAFYFNNGEVWTAVNTAAAWNGIPHYPVVRFCGTGNSAWPAEVTSVPGSFSNANIDSEEELAWVVSMVNGLNGVTSSTATTNASLTYTLTADLDMSDYVWVPIGTAEHPFTGTFEGNGHTITGIHRDSEFPHQGLFGYTEGATIQNVIVNVGISGNSLTTGAVVGTYAGTGTIANVEGAGTLTGGTLTTAMGGLVGSNANATIHSSFAVAGLTGGASATQIGGLVGNNTGDLYNSYSNATYAGTSATKGGLVGTNSGTVENCYAAGIESGVSAFAGSNSGTIQYCYTDAIGSGYIGTNSTAPTGSATYGAVQSSIKHLDYMYRDNLITKNTNTYVGSEDAATEVITHYFKNHIPIWNGLVSALNQWVRTNPEIISDLSSWYRPLTNNINGDLPVLAFPKDSTLVTTDGKYLQYSASLDHLLSEHASNTAYMFHYGHATGVTQTPGANVHVYVQEDAVLLQATSASAFSNTTVGVTFDNSDHGQHAYDFWGNKLNYDWHLLSTPLYRPLTGATHSSYVASGDPYSYVDVTNIGGYFPNGLITSGNPAVGGTIKWDFYTYYEPHYHWINLKRNQKNHYHQDGGAIIPYNEPDQDLGGNTAYYIEGKGYEMAISQNTFMNATGTLNRGNVSITLTNQEPDDIQYASGWNLVGNPYQAYLDIDKIGKDPIYTYDADQGIFVPYTKTSSENPAILSQYIHPHQAFFVHADSDGETLTFTQGMATTTSTAGSYYREKLNYPLVNLFAEDDAGHRDLTVVEFHRPELGGAPKFDYMRTAPFSLAAHYAGTSYGILFATDDLKRIPVRFQTTENGTVTLTWSTYNGEFYELRLIDNKLGVDYNMLASNSYTFDATIEDYASRFYIVYDCSGTGVDENEDGSSSGSGTFAYIGTDGNIVIDIDAESSHGASLQVVDVLGRVLYSTVCRDGVHTVSTNGLAKGVYLLRLTNGNMVKTQKIVVR